MRYCVHIRTGIVYAAESQADAEAVLEAIVAGNRWAMDGERQRMHIDVQSGDPDPIPLRDKVFFWHCSIEVGYAGWNAEPIPGMQDREQVTHKNGESRGAYVYAPSALDAIAKAQLLMLC